MANLGFDAVEVEVVHEPQLLEFRERKGEVKKLCGDLGLKVINVCAIFPDVVSLDDSLWSKALKHFEESCVITRFLDCDMIQLDSFTPPLRFIGTVPYKEAISFGIQFKVEVDPGFSYPKLWSRIVDSFKRCSRIADEYGLKLCLEPRVGENISNTDAMLRLIEAVNADNFYAVLDVGHLHAQKEILPLSVEKLGSRISYVHASDNDGRDNLHLPPGKGTVDWEGVVKALAKHGYKGYIAVDIGGAGYRGDIDSDVIESKCFLENLLSRLSLLN
jgi:sugar phosphate isomerase/epimerase